MPKLHEQDDMAAVFNVYTFLDTRSGSSRPSCSTPLPWDAPEKLLLSLNMHNVHPSTALLRRSAVEALGGFDESIRMCDDWDLWLRLAERFSCRFVNQELATVRIHGRNVNLTCQGEWAANVRKAIDNALERSPDLYRSVRKPLLSRFHFWAGFYAYRLLNMGEARRHLFKSMLHRPNLPALRCLPRAMLGAPIVRRLRHLMNRE